MAMAKRIILFLAVNFLVVMVISFVLRILNLEPYLRANGLNYNSLMVFCLIWGMGGAFISLALSRIMAKWSAGVQVIDPNQCSRQEQELLNLVYRLADKAGLSARPEVGIYESDEVNAFATGPTQSRSLVAVSTGILRKMSADELEAVLGHEVSHIANGDMVTMTLLQGIVNAFVMFLARALAYVATKAFSKDRDDSESIGNSFIYFIMVMIFQTVFMFLGMIVIAAYSRRREYRADEGGAALAGTSKMIAALQALKRAVEIPVQEPGATQSVFQSMKISNYGGLSLLFSTHPSIEQRIERLKNLSNGRS